MLVSMHTQDEHLVRRRRVLAAVGALAGAGPAFVILAMWCGIFAAAGTSPELVMRLNRDLKDILALPDVRAAFETPGMDPASSTPEEFRRPVEQDADRWAALIKAQGITAD